MKIDRPVDNLIAALHAVLPSYCLEPSVIRQATGVSSVVVPSEPLTSDFVYPIRA